MAGEAVDAVQVLGGTAAHEHRYPGGRGEAAISGYGGAGLVPGGRASVADRKQGGVTTGHGRLSPSDPGLGPDPGASRCACAGVAPRRTTWIGSVVPPGNSVWIRAATTRGWLPGGKDPFVGAAEIGVGERYGQDGEHHGDGGQVAYRGSSGPCTTPDEAKSDFEKAGGLWPLLVGCTVLSVITWLVAGGAVPFWAVWLGWCGPVLLFTAIAALFGQPRGSSEVELPAEYRRYEQRTTPRWPSLY